MTAARLASLLHRHYLKYDPDKHHRRSIRVKGYDYSQAGAYFITICTKNRESLFGEIIDNEIVLNDIGRLIQLSWFDLPNHYAHIELDEFVAMPNHIHGIIFFSHPLTIESDVVGAGLKPAPTRIVDSRPISKTKRQPLSEIVRAFKTFSARRINAYRNTAGSPVWQRNYYEHIIRNEDDLNRIRQYIIDNPRDWDRDQENPQSR